MATQIVVVLDNIRSALNVGAILRTCDGAAVSKVYLCGVTPQISHFKIGKTALGAEFNVETIHVDETTTAIMQLKQQGFSTVAVEQTASALALQDYNVPDKVAFIFGHETAGVTNETLAAVEAHVQLPMLGKKNSLNVATTVGIVVYYLRLTELKNAAQ